MPQGIQPHRKIGGSHVSLRDEEPSQKSPHKFARRIARPKNPRPQEMHRRHEVALLRGHLDPEKPIGRSFNGHRPRPVRPLSNPSGALLSPLLRGEDAGPFRDWIPHDGALLPIGAAAPGGMRSFHMNQRQQNPSDELVQFQLRVARRADELARNSRIVTPLNLHCWLMAELELMDRLGAQETPRPYLARGTAA